LGLEAEGRGYEDHVDAVGGLVVDLREQASGVAGALHADVFSGQAVFAYAAKAFVDVAHEFLVTDDEDDVAAGVGVRAELAARA